MPTRVFTRTQQTYGHQANTSQASAAHEATFWGGFGCPCRRFDRAADNLEYKDCLL